MVVELVSGGPAHGRTLALRSEALATSYSRVRSCGNGKSEFKVSNLKEPFRILCEEWMRR